jgi:hypothetical protein
MLQVQALLLEEQVAALVEKLLRPGQNEVIELVFRHPVKQ